MKFKETVSQSVNEYLESTTIHGFSYLSSSGRNVLVKFGWAIIISTCFTLAALLIQQSIEEATLNPVMTNVETIPIQQVPFPAITINSGEPDTFNPWGYPENIFNGLAFMTNEEIYGELPGADYLRDSISTVLDSMIQKMNQSFDITSLTSSSLNSERKRQIKNLLSLTQES